MFFNKPHSCCTYLSDYPPYYYAKKCFDLDACPPEYQGLRLTNAYDVPNCGMCGGGTPMPPMPPTQQDYKQDMPRIPEFMYSRYGWKIKEVNGKKFWAAMNKKEYQIEAANSLGIHPSEVPLPCGMFGDTRCDWSCPAGENCFPTIGQDGLYCSCFGRNPQNRYSY